VRYCEVHEKQRERQYNATRPSGAERGYGSAWRKVRDAYIKDNPWCADPFGVHLMPGHAELATHVDHVVPLKAGGTDDPSNLQSLCTSCHSRKSAVEGSRWPKR